ncbi:hypothetical protein WJX79_010722 [Trebouxia sp. C0005]
MSSSIPEVFAEIRQLFSVAAQHDVHLDFIWEPRETASMVYADELSRMEDSSELFITRRTFTSIICRQVGEASPSREVAPEEVYSSPPPPPPVKVTKVSGAAENLSTYTVASFPPDVKNQVALRPAILRPALEAVQWATALSKLLLWPAQAQTMEGASHRLGDEAPYKTRRFEVKQDLLRQHKRAQLGIFFSTSTGHTEEIAGLIKEGWTSNRSQWQSLG